MAMAREKHEHRFSAATAYSTTADEEDLLNGKSFSLHHMKQIFSSIRGLSKRDGGRDKECKAV
jgi:hypothetical protein